MKTEELFANFPILETRRLLLRKLNLNDVDDIFEYGSDPEITKYLLWNTHESIEDSLDFVNSVIKQYESGQVAPWGIIHKSERKLIGTCGFGNWRPRHFKAEIGYALSRKYWNRGIMTEAVKEVIAFGFNVMNLNRIQAMCHIENLASVRVMEKVGMKYEGTLREYLFSKGVYRDQKMYSIIKRESLYA